MATVNYTLRLEETDKQQAEQIFNQLGLTLAAGLNVYIKTVAREQRIPFNLSLNEPVFPKPQVTKEEKKRSFQALDGVLAGYEVDLDKEREERILSR